MHIVISGAGISGLAAALSLTKFIQSPAAPTITILEIRPKPGAVGGAINLTPKCQRYLHHLGVHQKMQEHGYGADVRKFEFLASESGAIGQLDCSNGGKGFGDPPLNCLRILRSDLIRCLVEAVAEHDNVTVRYGVQLEALEESPSDLTLTLSDRSTLNAELLLVCDGVHSKIRTKFVEPERKPRYTGCAAAIGFADVTEEDRAALPFQDTCIMFGQRGRFFCSYYNTARDCVFLGAQLGQQEENLSRDGWSAKGTDHAGVRNTLAKQFSDTAIHFVKDFIEKADNWFLYPVYTLPAKGKWVAADGKIVLLGDAAHAMPPQGESSGYAIEDTIVYARTLAKATTTAQLDLNQVSQTYEALRRPKIDAAFVEAHRRWSGTENSWWIMYKLKIWLLPWLIWLLAGKTNREWEEDLVVAEFD